jgi:hypothetical protein
MCIENIYCCHSFHCSDLDLGLPASPRAVRVALVRAEVKQIIREQRRATSECLLPTPCIMCHLESKHPTRHDEEKLHICGRCGYINPCYAHVSTLPSDTRLHTLLHLSCHRRTSHDINLFPTSEDTAMTTGVIPRSGIPSFNMTSEASHSSSPPALTVPIWFIISWIVISAMYYSIEFIVLGRDERPALQQVEAGSTSTRFMITWMIATTLGYIIHTIIHAISLYLATRSCNASTRWFRSSTDSPKPVATSTFIDDTNYTPDQDPTPTINAIMSRMISLVDKATKVNDQLGEHLSVLNNTANRMVHQ